MAAGRYSEAEIEEEVIDITMQACFVCLSEHAMNPLATSRKDIYPVCLLHNIEFHMLVQEQKPRPGEALAEFVDFVLADLPYNIRCVWNDKNSNHYILASAKMKAM